MSVAVAGLAITVAGMYVLLAVHVTPRMARLAPGVRWLAPASWAAGAFFVGCAVTHVAIAVHTIAEPHLVESHAAVHLLPHVVQIAGGALVVWMLLSKLDVDIRLRSQIEAERQLERQRGDFERSNRMNSLGQLAGTVAHDFNNVLAIILNFAQFARNQVDDPQVAEDLDQVIDAAQRGADLTQQLLLFSRRQTPDREVIDLNSTLVRIKPLVARIFAPDGRFELRLGDGVPPVGLGLGQLQQIVVNVAMNARDAMPDGGTFTVITEGLDGPDGRRALIRLGDTGSGMPAEVAERAFEPFFTTKPAGHGTGFGLATVQSITRSAGGFVRLETAPGQGTTVTLELPGAVIAGSPPEGDAPVDSLDGLRVLLVEDEATVRRGIQRILESELDLLSAGDPHAALDLLAHDGRVDVLLTDMGMPGMTGAELISQVRAAHPQVGVVCMSGWLADETPAGVPQEAVLLAKPFTRDSLRGAIRAAARQSNGCRPA